MLFLWGFCDITIIVIIQKRGIELKKIPVTIKKSLLYAFSIIAGTSTIAGIWGYTLKDINEQLQWWKCGIILLAVLQ